MNGPDLIAALSAARDSGALTLPETALRWLTQLEESTTRHKAIVGDAVRAHGGSPAPAFAASRTPYPKPQRGKLTAEQHQRAVEKWHADTETYRRERALLQDEIHRLRGCLNRWAEANGAAFIDSTVRPAVDELARQAEPFHRQLKGLDINQVALRGTQDQIRAVRKIADLEKAYVPLRDLWRALADRDGLTDYAARRRAVREVPPNLPIPQGATEPQGVPA